MRRGMIRAAGVIGAGLAAGGALALMNRALLLDDLPPTLPGAMHDWLWQGHRVRYTTLGEGPGQRSGDESGDGPGTRPPLVLVHSVHAAASSFEWRDVFEPLSRHRTVYALDLLGFGKSERPSESFSGPFYRDLLGAFLGEVVGRPAVVVGSSLGAAYAVGAARVRPGLVDRLVLISPTGTTRTGLPGRISGTLLGLPLIGQAGFNALTSQGSIRHYLEQVFADPGQIDESMVGQSWATAHQPNARLAPAAFIAGRLDLPLTADATPIRAPILVLRGSVAGLGRAASNDELVSLGPRVTIRTIDGVGSLPQDEAPDEVVRLIEAWLADAD
jgi:pimeloyl-ACP methyl ester carboxylesterase